MKIHRLNAKYRKNSSKLHQRVGDILRCSPIFSGHKIYQEYPVDRINPNYPSSAHKFDWVILDMFLVIECMGEQHYKPCTFGGISIEEAEANLRAQRVRDVQKMEAAITAGYTYIAVPYTDFRILDENYLWSLYTRNRNNDIPLVEELKPDNDSIVYQERLKKKAREYRRTAYQKQKAWAEKMKAIRRDQHG